MPYFFFICLILEARANLKNNFVHFLVQMRTRKFAFKINWPLGCASEAGILKWWHTTFAHTFVCTQPQNAKILLENIYADENVFFRIPSNLLLFNKNFVKLNSGVSERSFNGHIFKIIIISCSESRMIQNLLFGKFTSQ